MKNTKLCSALFLLIFMLFIAVAPIRGEIILQCPPDIDGEDTDGDGIVDNDHLCIHLSAGDGFVNMARTNNQSQERPESLSKFE